MFLGNELPKFCHFYISSITLMQFYISALLGRMQITSTLSSHMGGMMMMIYSIQLGKFTNFAWYKISQILQGALIRENFIYINLTNLS